MQAYTVFYCKEHLEGFIVENIHRKIPDTCSICNLPGCNINLRTVGYITLNNGIITDDIDKKMFLNISKDLMYTKDFKLIKLEDHSLLKTWVNHNYDSKIVEAEY